MRNTWTIPVANGQPVPGPILLKLGAQQTAIRSVTVDNTNSGLTVKIYRGPSAEGIPYVVGTGRIATIATPQTSSVYVVFEGTIDRDAGPIYLSWSDEDRESLPTYWVGIGQVDKDVTIPVSGDLEIDTSTPLDVNVVNATSAPVPIQGTVGIALQPIQVDVVNAAPIPVSVPSPLPVQSTGVVASQITGPFPLQVDAGTNSSGNPLTVNPNPVQYPPAALGTRINQFSILSFTSSTALPIQLLSQPSTGQGAFFTVLYFWGLDSQKQIEWNFQSRNNAGAYIPILRGWGDKTLNFSGPYFYCPAVNVAQGIFWNFVNNNAIIGTLQVRVMLMGWWA